MRGELCSECYNLFSVLCLDYFIATAFQGKAHQIAVAQKVVRNEDPDYDPVFSITLRGSAGIVHIINIWSMPNPVCI